MKDQKAVTAKAPGPIQRQPQEDFCRGLDDGQPVAMYLIREKRGEFRPGYADPIGGKDITTQVSDVAFAMAIHLRGGDPRGFGFLWPTALDAVKVADPFNVGVIGFRSAEDRKAAHKKAKEWLEKPLK